MTMMFLSMLALLLVFDGSTVAQTEELTGFIGESVILPCTCPQNTKTLSWQIGEQLVKASTYESKEQVHRPSTALFLNEDETNCSLLLKNLSVADEAIYICYTTDNERILSTTYVNLTVSESRKNPFEHHIGSDTVVSASVSASILLVVGILAVVLFVILQIKRRHRENKVTDSRVMEPMMETV